MARWLIGAVLIGMVVLPVQAWAQDDDYSLEFAYTLLTKRSVIEREIEFKFNYEKGSEGRSFEWVGALEWVLLPRWQIELEIPIVLQGPKEGRNEAGIGDIELTNRVLLYKGLDPPTLVTAGLEAKLPTGSQSRGTGGEATLEPFLAAGMAFGSFDFQASVAYEFGLQNPFGQQFEAAAAVAYRLSRWFTPLLEVQLIQVTKGEAGDPLLNRAQVSILPGFNVRPFPGATIAAGVEVPLTSAKAFDYAVRALFVWEF
jgi:Putative MetA-pathway of phenol degradation